MNITGLSIMVLLIAVALSGCHPFESAIQDAVRPVTDATGEVMGSTASYYAEHNKWPRTRNDLLDSEQPYNLTNTNISELVFIPNDDGSLTVVFEVATQKGHLQRIQMGKPHTTQE